MGIFQKIAMDSVGYGIVSVLARSLNYAMVFFHVRWFSEADYGTLSMFYASTALLNIVYILAMETSFFRFVDKANNKKQIATLQYIITLWSLFLSALILYYARHIGRLIGNEEDYHSYIQLFAGILFCDAMCSIPFAKLRAQRRVKLYVWLKSINVAVNVGVQFFLVYASDIYVNDNAVQSITVVFIANLIASAVVWIFLWKESVFSLRIDIPFARKVIVYSLPLTLGGMAAMINETLDRILLPYLHNDGQEAGIIANGIYAANYKLSILITLFVQAYRMGAEPILFNVFKVEKRARETYAHLMLLFVITLSAIGLIITLFLPIWKYWIVSEQHPGYQAGLYTIPILVLANIMLGIYFNLSIWYKVVNKTKFGMIFSLIGALFTISLNLLLVPLFSFWACAWITAGSYMLITLLSYFASRKYYPIPYASFRILCYLLLASVLTLLKVLVDVHTNISQTLNILVGTAMLALFGVIVYSKERKRLLAVLRNSNT